MIATLAGTSSHTAPGANASYGARSGVSTPEPQTPAGSGAPPTASPGETTGQPSADEAAPAGNNRLIDLQTFNSASNSPEQGDEESADPSGLTEEEKAQLDELKQRDREVRAHEQAHAAAGGAYAGSPSYEYESGPDGNRYAVGGEVSIDTSPISGDPEATIQKMEVVKRAALAPAEPSPQDRAVAAQADQARLKAQAELREQRSEEQQAAKEGGQMAQAGRAAGAYAQAAQIDNIVSQINIAA
jgi:hypothetical protein